MKKYLLVFTASLLFFITCSNLKFSSDPYSEYTKSFKMFEERDFQYLKNDIEKNFSSYDELKKITKDLEHRYTGSENGRLAEEFIYKKLTDYGLEVRYFPFKMKIWKRKSATLTMYSTIGSEVLDIYSFGYTPLLSDVTGEIIDLGDGQVSDFKKNKERIKGNIILLNIHIMGDKKTAAGKKKPNPPRWIKTKRAFKYGAAGVIFINKYYGEILMTGTASKNNRKLIPIPAVCVSVENGEKIRSIIASGNFTKGHIQVTGEVEDIEARCIVARIPGLEKPEERIVIGGHLDTWDLGQGAIDNGIGSFAILDIARVFKKNYIIPHRTIEFIFWMGEEHGLIGSREYIKSEIDNDTIDEIKYYVNIDMHGNPKGFDIEGRDETADYFTSIGEDIKSLGIDFDNEQKSKPTMVAYSDDLNFSIQGIPVIQEMSGLGEKVYQYYHTSKDNFNLVNKDHFMKSSLVMSILLYKLANDRVLPAKVFSIEETRTFFTEKGGMGALSEEYNWDYRLKKDKEKNKKNK